LKITKLSLILFIFLLVVSLIPPIGGVTEFQADRADQSNGLALSQATTSSNVLGDFVNASISNYQRNITVLTDAKVVLEDEFRLNVLDDETEIATLNISVPAEFGNHIHRVRIYTQFNDDLGLNDPSNLRDFSVFYGQEVTTLFVDITQDGFGANSTAEGTFVKVEMITVGMLAVETFSTGQRIEFLSPVTPMINNIEVKHSTVGVAVAGKQDTFAPNEIDRIENALGDDMPRFTDTSNVISYLNMSRDAFNYADGIQEADEQRLVFTSETPITQDLITEDLSTTVPTKLQNAERTVFFNPWGTVEITEEITVVHLGGERNITDRVIANVHQVAGYLYTVDSDAIITDVYDDFGSLEQSTRDEDTGYPQSTASAASDGKQDLRINFRAPIYGGQTYTFTVEYMYNASQIIAVDSETNQYTLNTTLFSDFNTTVQDMTVRYQFPAGTTIVDHTYQSKSRFADYSVFSQVDRRTLSAFSHIELVIQGTDMSFVDNQGFSITFFYNGFGHVQWFATFMYSMIILLGLAYALSNIKLNPSRAVEIEKELVPVDKMDNFFNLFSEKIGAEKRIADLRSRRQKGKLSKKDYDGQVKSVRRRLRDLNPQLEKAAASLSAEGGRYDNYVKKVMLASQRQTDIRRNAREAKISYEKGNTPKNIYTLRIKEFNDQLKREELTISKTLTEMIETIQKFNQ